MANKEKDQAAPEEAKDSSSTTAQWDTAARPITMAQYDVCAASKKIILCPSSTSVDLRIGRNAFLIRMVQMLY